tara:strand:- start:12152 stop:12283 length:132 start_codon:yes stop_codon:yes gene_type:complete
MKKTALNEKSAAEQIAQLRILSMIQEGFKPPTLRAEVCYSKKI